MAARMNHDSYSSSYITDILRDIKTIALVGASNNEVRPSFFVLNYLLEKGYQVFPINPGLAGKEISGQQVYATLAEVPVAIDMVDIFRNSEAALGITEEALALPFKPKVIWMQLGVQNDVAAKLAESQGLKVVMNRCPKMEFGKVSGEWAWVGGNSGIISSKRQVVNANGRMQSLGIAPRK
jgi:uncharacterized protein